jgi:hypothetical protein
VLDKLLHRENQRQFPPHDNLDDLTNMFADFFVRKMDTIRSQLHLAAVDNLLGFESSCGTVKSWNVSDVVFLTTLSAAVFRFAL